VLLTTQYLEEADRLADHVVVIDHGRIIASGAPAELKRNVGSTFVDVGLRSPATAKRAATALARTGIAPPSVVEATVELAVHDGARALVAVMRALEKARIVPVTLEVREATLDDVFLALTGHGTEDETAAAASAATTARGAA
jgi:ABC-type multidrug transport system ATPase subunit